MTKAQTKAPQCVGFIMDGNRRWASERGLQTFEGHRAGYESLTRIIDAVYAEHIPHMVCYAFSTENWKRSSKEVAYLMDLFKYALDRLTRSAKERKVNIKFIGERERFDLPLQKGMAEVERSGYTNPELTVWFALSYGGRAEIIDAVNRAVVKKEKVTEGSFAALLWTNGMPDPDLIIRTSGEERLSNFLLWQSAYSELFFTKTYWPDFGETEFRSILEEYGKRQRRRGA